MILNWNEKNISKKKKRLTERDAIVGSLDIFSIDLAPNRISYGAKTIGNV